MMSDKHIKETALGYINSFKAGTSTRWDLINFFIGYYGNIGAEHIAVIQELLRDGYILH